MKIKSWRLEVVWEDDAVNEISSYLPEGTAREVEDFIDYWEAKYNDDVVECYDEEDEA